MRSIDIEINDNWVMTVLDMKFKELSPQQKAEVMDFIRINDNEIYKCVYEKTVNLVEEWKGKQNERT